MKNVQLNRQQGSAMLALLAILVLAVAGGVGFWLWHNNQKQASPTQTSSSSTSSSSSSSSSSATVANCSSLSLSKGTSEGAAGTMYTHAVVTNTGNATCDITGYPGVFLLDNGGAVLGSGAAANPLTAAATIKLAPGGQAHTVLGLPNAGNFDTGACSATSSILQVFVPGLATPLTTPWASQSCPGFSATAFVSGA